MVWLFKWMLYPLHKGLLWGPVNWAPSLWKSIGERKVRWVTLSQWSPSKESRLQLTPRCSSPHVVEKYLPRKIARIGQYWALELCPLQQCYHGEFLTISWQKTTSLLLMVQKNTLEYPNAKSYIVLASFLHILESITIFSLVRIWNNVPNCFIFLFREIVKCEYMLICGLASS